MPKKQHIPKTSTRSEGVTLHKGSRDFLSFSLVIYVMDIHWVWWGKMQKKKGGFEKMKCLLGMVISLFETSTRNEHFSFQNAHQEQALCFSKCLLFMNEKFHFTLPPKSSRNFLVSI
jgi:hypothetical protein